MALKCSINSEEKKLDIVETIFILSLSGEMTFDDSAKQWIIKFSGSYPEDQGTTTTNYALVLNSTFNEMIGDENWDWVGGGGSCPCSKSTVAAKIKLTCQH